MLWRVRLVKRTLTRSCEPRRFRSVLAASRPPILNLLGNEYPTDDKTNITPAIIEKLGRNLYLQPAHPLGILRALTEAHFRDFTAHSGFSPIVTPAKNFDDLGFPEDHPGRALSDSYYINQDAMLRTHTSAHEVELFARGDRRWLLTSDVYRRDEIDSTHYPVFHQMEGARSFSSSKEGIDELEADNARLSHHLAQSNIVIEDIPHSSPANPIPSVYSTEHAERMVQNLKLSLNSLMLALFGGRAGSAEEPLRVRWIEAYFPFTSPSFEVEVFFHGKWIEILGSGLVQQRTMQLASQYPFLVSQSRASDLVIDTPNDVSWAFGLGLERIAMILFAIPDIRLFWSADPRFLEQFTPGDITTFKPYSKFPPCYKDVSFWFPEEGLHDNDVFDLVRDTVGDSAEDVKMVCAHSSRTALLAKSFCRSTASPTPKRNGIVGVTESTTDQWTSACRPD